MNGGEYGADHNLFSNVGPRHEGGFGLYLSWETLRAAQAQSQDPTCPGPSQVILSESGGDVSRNAQGNVNYGPFTTTSDSFVVTMDASSSEPGGAAVSVSVLDRTPNPLVIREQAFQTPGTESLLIQEGPGKYVVSVGYGAADYTVTVEECTSGSTGGASATLQPTPQPTPQPAPQPRDPGLLDAEGPSHGPLPLMSDGSCPREFPVKRGDACYE